MLLKLDARGRLVQASPYSDDGEGPSIAPMGVLQENVFVEPAAIMQHQKNAKARADIENARMQFIKNQIKIKKQANQIADQIKRSNIMGSQIDAPTREELLILKQVNKDKFGNADFSQFEQMRASEDFGHDADFQTYSTYGNPLTPDGNIGPLTDYERFVLADQFNMPIGVKNNQSMGTMLDVTMPRKKNRLRNRQLGQGSMSYPTMVKYGLIKPTAHPMSGMGDDLIDYVYTGGDPTLDAILDAPDVTTIPLDSSAASASPTSSPGFWSSITSALSTAAPSLLSTLTKQATPTKAATTTTAKAPTTAVVGTSSTVAIPFTSIQVSKVTLLMGALVLGAGTYFMIRGMSSKPAKAAATA